MTWKKLLAERRVGAEPTSKPELDELRTVVARNLADAALPGLSADGKFSLAYNAARATATMLIRCAGYRVKSGGGGRVARAGGAVPGHCGEVDRAASPAACLDRVQRRLRRHAATGRALGSAGFLTRLEAPLGCVLRPQKSGRKRTTCRK